MAACNGDATRSALHVVVIDEIDAVFRRRSAGEDAGEQTRVSFVVNVGEYCKLVDTTIFISYTVILLKKASVVNQILSKLDGVNAIDNILMVGMTNRRELLDSALLRPGRLEVQIEVPMPDEHGRREILKIHFGTLRERGRLSKQLCHTIDGLSYLPNIESEANSRLETDTNEVFKERKRDTLKRGLITLFHKVRPCYDLAAETDGFSGADIAGLVRSVSADQDASSGI